MTGVTISVDDARTILRHHGFTSADTMGRHALTSALQILASQLAETHRKENA
jgi:hypothetical protein